MAQRLKTQVYFSSDRFPMSADERDPEGPELWNEALATFLFEGLRAKGIAVGEPYAEDSCYCMEIANDSFRVFVGCGPIGDEGEFTAFVMPSEPVVGFWFSKVPTGPVLQPILAALDAVLAEPGITKVTWEFP